jgi:hypothetical protein
MPNVFLSYSRQDEAIADTIATEIERGGSSVFRDTALAAGSNFASQIEDEIQRADVVIVLLSRNTSRSKWVQNELINALEQKKEIIPVLLDQDAKDNYVWSLVADRQVIEGGRTESAMNIARRVSGAVLRTEALYAGTRSVSSQLMSGWRLWAIIGTLLAVSSGVLVGYRQQVLQEQLILRERTALASAQEGLGDQLAEAAPEKALVSFQAALDIRKRLLAADPNNLSLLHDLATNYERIGNVASRAGEKSRALEAYREGRAIIANLKKASPADASLQSDLDRFDQRIAELQR